MSMRSTPSSTARRSTRMAPSWSAGGPHTPGPVSCIAPNPSRCTVSVPNGSVPESSTIVLTSFSLPLR